MTESLTDSSTAINRRCIYLLADNQTEWMTSLCSDDVEYDAGDVNVTSLNGQVGAFNWRVLPLLLLVAAGITGNTLVCASIVVERKLRNVTNYFLVSLAVADLFVSLVVMPCCIVQEFIGRWPFGLIMCDIWQLSDVVMCTSSIMHMCTISMDRYSAISDPLRNRVGRCRSASTVSAKIAAVWLVSIAIGSPLIGLGALRPMDLLGSDGQCAISNTYYLIYGSLTAFFGPLTIMLAAFSLTIRLLNRQAKSLGTDLGGASGGTGNGENGGGMRRWTVERRRRGSDKQISSSWRQGRRTETGQCAGRSGSEIPMTTTMMGRLKALRTVVASDDVEATTQQNALSLAADRAPEVDRPGRQQLSVEDIHSVAVSTTTSEDIHDTDVNQPSTRRASAVYDVNEASQPTSHMTSAAHVDDQKTSERRQTSSSSSSTSSCSCETEHRLQRSGICSDTVRLLVVSTAGGQSSCSASSPFVLITIDRPASRSSSRVTLPVLPNSVSLDRDVSTPGQKHVVDCRQTSEDWVTDGERRTSSRLRKSASDTAGVGRNSRLGKAAAAFLGKRCRLSRSKPTINDHLEQHDVQLQDTEEERLQLLTSLTSGSEDEVVEYVTSSREICPLGVAATDTDVQPTADDLKVASESTPLMSCASGPCVPMTSSNSDVSERCRDGSACAVDQRVLIASDDVATRRKHLRQQSTDDDVTAPCDSHEVDTNGAVNDVPCSSSDPQGHQTTDQITSDTSPTSPVTPGSPNNDTIGATKFKGLVRKHGAAFKVAGLLAATREDRQKNGSCLKRGDRQKKAFNSVNNERKAVKVLGAMFVIFVTSWAPFFTTNLMMGICKECNVDELLFKVFLWLGYASSTLNPIIYTVFNRDFKNTFIRLLRCRCTEDEATIRVSRLQMLARQNPHLVNGGAMLALRAWRPRPVTSAAGSRA